MILALAITGPTGSGKTALSLSVAKAFEAEILSLDSMQIYRYMDIGTAKATKEEQTEVPHHLIDILDPGERFSAKEYEDLALPLCHELTERGKRPLFVGGTGLYLDSLTRTPPPEIPGSDPAFREALCRRFGAPDGTLDAVALWEYLRLIDPESAEKTHPNNTRRVARALEIYESTGRTKSEHDRISRAATPRIAIAQLSLDIHNRETLYRRIDERVDKMLGMGLLEELEGLIARGFFEKDSTARQAIGYKELLPHFESGAPLALCIENLKMQSRRYAKRQLTWFRHTEGAYPLYLDREDGTLRSGEELFAEAKAFFEKKIAEHSQN